jgi:CHASE2 domain-containing sensor protein
MREGLRQFVNNAPFAKAALFAGVLTAFLGFISAKSPLFNSFEYWTADWRTALLADKAKRQHPDLAVVLVDEVSLTGLAYRSPIDRALLAGLVKSIDEAGARVIGLDFIFDQATEPAKDNMLLETIKGASAKVVLGGLDERVRVEERQREFNKQFLGEAGRPAGYINMRTEFDGTVRVRADADPGSKLDTHFAEAIAREAGAGDVSGSKRIAWLRHGDTEDAFLVIPAHQLLKAGTAEEQALRSRLLSRLKGRVVLIGANLEDRRDSFTTPLSKISEPLMPGVVIYTHIVAQILDNRDYIVAGRGAGLVMAAISAFFGFLLGWKFQNSTIITSLAPLGLYLILDVIAFSQFRVILPFALPAVAWLLGVFAAQALRWWEDRRASPILR